MFLVGILDLETTIFLTLCTRLYHKTWYDEMYIKKPVAYLKV